MSISSRPILSLCIPTYNRGESLGKALESIVRETQLQNKIEIVISDNASTDETEKIVQAFTLNCKNIRYVRNENNIGGENNFVQALALGTGHYLKLMNDYLEFTPGCLEKVVELIETQMTTKEVIFFSNGHAYTKNKGAIVANDLNAFIRICSYFTTWIGCFGIWREDFDRINSGEKDYKKLNLFQTEVILENFKLKNKAVIYNATIFKLNSVASKGGYNIFEIFVNNYFNNLMFNLLEEGRINKKTYELEKRRLLRGFIVPWIKILKIRKDPTYRFGTENMNEIVYQTYKNDLLYYCYKMLYLPVYKLYFSLLRFKST